MTEAKETITPSPLIFGNNQYDLTNVSDATDRADAVGFWKDHDLKNLPELRRQYDIDTLIENLNYTASLYDGAITEEKKLQAEIDNLWRSRNNYSKHGQSLLMNLELRSTDAQKKQLVLENKWNKELGEFATQLVRLNNNLRKNGYPILFPTFHHMDAPIQYIGAHNWDIKMED